MHRQTSRVGLGVDTAQGVVGGAAGERGEADGGLGGNQSSQRIVAKGARLAVVGGGPVAADKLADGFADVLSAT